MSLLGPRFADGDQLDVAGAIVRLRVHARARRVSLRLDRTRREVVATAPSVRRLAEAAAFARSRSDWVVERLAELPTAQPISPGMAIELFGRIFRLEHASRGIDPATPGVLFIRGEGDAFRRAAIRRIRLHALDILSDRTAIHCQTLEARLPSVTIMDAKGRWGSCRSGFPGKPAAIRYSWRLALAPFEVADYVAAHECAHLLEQNHGPRFWGHVARLVGDHRPHRAWLRAEAARLHAFGD
jgi:predicted metal-dependent hydrolase